MTTQNIFDLSDLWNDGATTFTAIKMNVTDTASASGSLLMDLQIGSASKFRVGKGAGAFFETNLIEFRNGVTAQVFRAYNTFTDASNYERGKIAWESNVLRIGTEKAGTGTARALEFQTDGVTRLTIGTGGQTTLTRPGGADPVLIVQNISSSFGYSAIADMLSPNMANGDIQTTLRFGRNVATNNLGYLGFRYVSNGSTSNAISYELHNGAGMFWTAGYILQLGGTTSSFPALKRSTTSLQVRLADDSAFTNVQGKITTETAYTAGAPTATGYLVLYDSNGTAYKVPAEAL